LGNNKIILLVISVKCILVIACAGYPDNKLSIQGHENKVEVSETILVDSVWAANKVSFALHSVGSRQFVAYYDKHRMMSVASRKLGVLSWEKTKLPSTLKWDSHNYVALGIDEAGYIHVSGNMHVDPLVYFRSTKPYDISSLIEVNKMIEDEESDVTYPKFFYDGEGRLYFSYRSGTCGNGNVLINQFNPNTNQWIRYLNQPLFEGIEKDDDRAAYHKSVMDSKGNFHYIWMWRWTPEVATSHQICYATSPDLINWKNAAGQVVHLPFRPDNKRLIVDPTPSKGGMHNSKYQLILTPNDEPLIAYLKYDEEGLTQLYLAKFQNGKWLREKISNWNFRWKFVGGGDKMTEGASFSLEGFTEDNDLLINWNNEKGAEGEYLIDINTLEVVHKEHNFISPFPMDISDKISNNSKLFVALQKDSGSPSATNAKYILKWEAQKKSHGRHAPDVIPEGPLSPLYLLEVTTMK